MPADRLPGWIAMSTAEYVESQIAAGRARADAERNAATSFDASFPDGKPAPGHAVLDVLDDDLEDDGEVVGFLWIGPDTSGNPEAWWVWNIAIDADKRGRGYGRAAMLLGEQYAREHGATTLGLNVFGWNAVARGLYEALGYETTAMQMRKPLGPAAG